MTRASAEPVTMRFDEHNGDLYPFTLEQKLASITERSTWYVEGGDSPWGRPIVPTEMISVLAHKGSSHFPVRGPAVGLFVDLEVRYVAGPVFVGQAYDVVHTVVGIGQSRRVESYWTESTITDARHRRPRRHGAAAPGCVQGVVRRLSRPGLTIRGFSSSPPG